MLILDLRVFSFIERIKYFINDQRDVLINTRSYQTVKSVWFEHVVWTDGGNSPLVTSINRCL